MLIVLFVQTLRKIDQDAIENCLRACVERHGDLVTTERFHTELNRLDAPSTPGKTIAQVYGFTEEKFVYYSYALMKCVATIKPTVPDVTRQPTAYSFRVRVLSVALRIFVSFSSSRQCVLHYHGVSCQV